MLNRKRIPDVEDKVHDYIREDKKLRPDGLVIDVDEDSEEVIVKYSSTVIVRQGRHIRVNGILYTDFILRDCPELLYEGGTTVHYFFDDLSWSSSNGGLGCWLIE